jgi:poly-gamma-glutamate synthesis protein (capsule biosynthesis protein)
MQPTGKVLENRRGSSLLILVGLVILLAGCSSLSAPGIFATPTRTPFRPVPMTPTPVPTATPSLSPTPTPSPTPVPSPTPEINGVWADPSVPAGLKALVTMPAGWQWVEQAELSRLRLEPAQDSGSAEIIWVYVLAAPFPTVVDDAALEEVKRSWRGESHELFRDRSLLVSADTRAVFQSLWGAASGEVVALGDDDLTGAVWDQQTWALLPFERLEPRLKALSVDGSSVLRRGDLVGYPLAIGYRSGGDIDLFLQSGGSLPRSNRDPSKLTVVLMTGTTALVRATGWRMEGLGLDYPARDIMGWLQEPDFTHISNESSFNPACPSANPNQESLMFCSRPEYIQLLDVIGADLIELSGNHNNDWGRDAFYYSLDLYRERGWRWFAGGENAEEARRPLLIEHNGNRLAFMGCNLNGPPGVWATADEPGAARCDLDWTAEQLRELRGDGNLPVMTFQYNEVYVHFATERQAADFQAMAEAGAAIVSGSQSHFPQGFAFVGDRFVHYGLGNLFFDQMDTPVDGTRREFLDRHVFYDGRYISTELLTAMLEDYARPRPMTAEERAALLRDVFDESDW